MAGPPDPDAHRNQKVDVAGLAWRTVIVLIIVVALGVASSLLDREGRIGRFLSAFGIGALVFFIGLGIIGILEKTLSRNELAPYRQPMGRQANSDSDSRDG